MKHHARSGDAPQSGDATGNRTSRRAFLKMGALAAASAGVPGTAKAWLPPASGPQGSGPTATGSRSNTLPGRIVMYQDDLMGGELSTIDYLYVEEIVLRGVRMLTGIVDTGQAFESLFPGLTANSTFAIKVNCIGPTDTRWEVVRGIVSGLSLMLGGTFDVSRVTIFDNHSLSAHGYTTSRFTFNGHAAVLSGSTNPGSYYVYSSYRLSNYIVNGNYVINVPALKSHDVAANAITVALKNHYGSCSPSSLCGDITGMLTVNADGYIKNKTGLVVTDALRGTYDGGPGNAPQYWSTYPAGTPNLLTFSTDPVTNEYWARSIINTERAAHSMSPKSCPWIAQASGAPYNLGVSDPGQMTVVEPSAVPEGPLASAGALFLSPGAPNPFGTHTTFSFHLGQEGAAELVILDASGRVVRQLARQSYPAGATHLTWNGEDDHGRSVPTGVYFARLESAAGSRTRRVVCTR
jgi:hypothetical protein